MSAPGAPRLALGTAQFGLTYGFDGAAPLTRDAIAGVLSAAWRGGVDLLDTAADYGPAEELVGELRPLASRFEVVSKTAPMGEQGAAAVERVCAGVRESLRRLRIGALEAILVHHAPDLLSPGGPGLYRALERLRAEGMARRIGVSIYDAPTLRAVLDAYPIEIVQLPVNILDQRLLQDGTLADLARRGIEVHARSVFLQGVLLAEPARLPERFRPARGLLERLRSACAASGVSPAAAALAFVARCPGVTRLIIGVNTSDQLRSNLDAFRSAMQPGLWPDSSAFALEDDAVVDPRNWAS